MIWPFYLAQSTDGAQSVGFLLTEDECRQQDGPTISHPQRNSREIGRGFRPISLVQKGSRSESQYHLDSQEPA